jgi:Abortive infection alpha
LWARLLAAALNPDQSKQGRLGFTDALKQLDPLDARVLVWMRIAIKSAPILERIVDRLFMLGDEAGPLCLSLVHMLYEHNVQADTSTAFGPR